MSVYKLTKLNSWEAASDRRPGGSRRSQTLETNGVLHTQITLHEDTYSPLLHLRLYNLYAWPLQYSKQRRTRKNHQSLILQVQKQFYNSKFSRAVDDVRNSKDLKDQV